MARSLLPATFERITPEESRTHDADGEQILTDGGRQRDDPPVRLIGLQSAHFLGVARVLDPDDYPRLIESCRARAAQRRNTPAA